MKIELRKFGDQDVLAFVHNDKEYAIVIEEKEPLKMADFLEQIVGRLRIWKK